MGEGSSKRLGIPGRFSDERFLAAVRRVVAAASREDKTVGFMALSSAEAEERLQQGFRCLAYGGDLWIYQQALGDGIRSIRQRLSARG